MEEKLKALKTPRTLVINKIDKIDPPVFEEIYKTYEALGLFDAIIGTSAISGKNVEALLDRLCALASEGPMFFPEDMITDHPERFLVSEIIREKLLMLLNDEVPHGIAVGVEEMSEREDKDILDIEATIICEKASHKGILIGKHGDMLKQIGTQARLDLEHFFGCKVSLGLWVKVKEDWRNRAGLLMDFGYDSRNFDG